MGQATWPSPLCPHTSVIRVRSMSSAPWDEMRPLCPSLPGAVSQRICRGLDWLFPSPDTPLPSPGILDLWVGWDQGHEWKGWKPRWASGAWEGQSSHWGREWTGGSSISLSSWPFLPHLSSQLPRFRESGIALGEGPPSANPSSLAMPLLLC